MQSAKASLSISTNLKRPTIPMLDTQILAIALASVFATQDFLWAMEDWGRLTSAAKTWTTWKQRYREAHAEQARLRTAQGTHSDASFCLYPVAPGCMGHACFSGQPGVSTNLTHNNLMNIKMYLGWLQQKHRCNHCCNPGHQLPAPGPGSQPHKGTQIPGAPPRRWHSIAFGTAPPGTTPNNTYLSLGWPVITTPTQTMDPRERLRHQLKTSDPLRYCWSHGYMVGKGHTSASCKHPKAGHNITATRPGQLS